MGGKHSLAHKHSVLVIAAACKILAGANLMEILTIKCVYCAHVIVSCRIYVIHLNRMAFSRSSSGAIRGDDSSAKNNLSTVAECQRALITRLIILFKQLVFFAL
jgi:hypothetical protein